MARRTRPILALTVGTVFALVLLEVALQVLSALTAPEQRGVAADGRPAILCVGDSNTYGIFLEAEDSYPGQLQAFLQAGGDETVVVNRGYPGQNTAQVRVGLAEALRDPAPRAVVVFCGVNDRWSSERRPVWSGEEPGMLTGLLAKSRVLKLVKLVRAAESADVATAPIAPDGRVTDELFPGPPKGLTNKAGEETRESIRTNLRGIAELCRARGAEVIFVGYPLFTESIRMDVNGPIHAAAEECGARYVDLEARFRELVGRVSQPQLYIPRDSHLSAIGNHEAARQVLIALRERGVVDVPVPPPVEEAYGGVSLALEREGDELVVKLSGPATWSWRLYAAGRAGAQGGEPGQLFSPDALGVEGDAFKAWYGRFDAEGRGTTRVRMPAPPESGAWSGWALSATALAWSKDPRDVRFSPLVAVPE